MISQTGVQKYHLQHHQKVKKQVPLFLHASKLFNYDLPFEAWITQNVSNSRPSPPPQTTRAPLQEPNVPWPCEIHTRDVTHVSGQAATCFTAKASGNNSYQRAIKGFTLHSLIYRSSWCPSWRGRDLCKLITRTSPICWLFRTAGNIKLFFFRCYPISVDSVGLPTLHKLHFLVCLRSLRPEFRGTGDSRANLLRVLKIIWTSTGDERYLCVRSKSLQNQSCFNP